MKYILIWGFICVLTFFAALFGLIRWGWWALSLTPALIPATFILAMFVVGKIAKGW